jgi:hypothetical protein
MSSSDFNRNTKLQEMLNSVPENLRARPDPEKQERPKTNFQYTTDNNYFQGMNENLHNPNVFKDENGKLILLDDKKIFTVADLVK